MTINLEQQFTRLMEARHSEQVLTDIMKKFEEIEIANNKLVTQINKLRSEMSELQDVVEHEMPFVQPSGHRLYVTLLEALLSGMGKQELIEVAQNMVRKLTTKQVVVTAEEEQG